MMVIGVNPDDFTNQIEYHRRNGRNEDEPSLCINKDSCRGSSHFYSHCPNVDSDEAYNRLWAEWTYKEELC